MQWTRVASGGSSSHVCPSAPTSRVSAYPRTRCLQIATHPGRNSGTGQETLIDRVIYN